MADLSVRLFGRFRVQGDDRVQEGLAAAKVQELFSYLLLHRDQSHPREALAGLLWGDGLAAQPKKYLRQALWQLQVALGRPSDSGASRLLVAEPEWVQLSSRADLWLDVAVFEQAFAAVEGTPGHALDEPRAAGLREAVQLYQGDLLEGWYQDWCLFERVRLQTIYLSMLDKLMAFCEAYRQYEAGLGYGARVLRLDRAHERTHRRLMRLHYLAGDRTAALRQYERCRAALDEELGVGPARRTVALFEQVRADRLGEPAVSVRPAPPEAADRLEQALRLLTELHHRLRQDLERIEILVNQRR